MRASDAAAVVRIGDVVKQVTDKVIAEAATEYRMAGVRWYAGGVFHRETVRGDEMSARYVTPLKPGALIYNRLFAWKESFAYVTAEHEGLFVSNEFPQFIPDRSRVLPEFLYLFCTIPSTTRLVNAASAGSAAVSRNRFKESEFTSFELRLPPLATQKSIVAHWQATQNKNGAAIAATNKREAAITSNFLKAIGIGDEPTAARPKAFAVNWTDVSRWAVSSLVDNLLGLDTLPKSHFTFEKLGDLSRVTYGLQKSPANRPGLSARPYLRVANVRKGYLDLSEVKEIEVQDSELGAYLLEPGDILFVEGNGSRAELGRVGKWSGEIENCVHQNHLIKVRLDQNRILPDFAMTWFNSDIGRSHFFRAAKSSSGLGTINSNEVRSAPIPVPPLSVQKRLVAEVTAAREQIAAERAVAEKLAVDTAREVEEMILGQLRVPTSKI